MWSITDGWAIAQAGENAYPSVVRTSDGGHTWREVSPDGAEPCLEPRYCTLSSLSSLRAWLVIQAPGESSAYPSVDSSVTVYSTGDGGQSWTAGVPFRIQQGAASAPVFVDPLHGWMLITLVEFHADWAVEIRRTNDGGRTWELASRTEPFMDDPRYPDTPAGLPVNCMKYGISFVDESDGWAAGDCLIETLFLYVTNDGGSTWAPRHTLPAPDGLPANAFERYYNTTWPPVFVAGRSGYMTVTLDIDGDVKPFLYTTSDGGINWVPHALPAGIWPLRFVTPSQGWAVDRPNRQLYSTTGGGADWNLVGTYPEGSAFQSAVFSFVDASHGWISYGDKVYSTGDGGRTWQGYEPLLALADG